ncbi:MAG: M20/M25/M40 family metallo-hydrolase [Proteobacteria bacterium]|nr:M20/M25/M40 family metallo-hydrolase [Pseudomonadota bacterium]MBU1708637.1 M20/M25/M40 family metallo-hydrolase [Pseudomonadota bacterium]
MLINPERLADIFVQLCETDSPSTQEGPVLTFLKNIFSGLGPTEIYEDGSAAQTGAECGNLIVRFDGGCSQYPPVLFNCHMDTVKPGKGVRVIRDGSRFSSAGDTVLGGDDKSGIAILIEAIRVIQEKNLDHGCVEFVFTTCEETGLLGAKALDHTKLRARIGYALDMDCVDQVIINAPTANKISVEITGKAAHAGLNPEQGINAIQIAAQAIASMKLGRLDHESTANFGIIAGGEATNIVPPLVRLEGEARSHSEEKLMRYTAAIENAFQAAVDGWKDPAGKVDGKPSVKITVTREYPVLQLSPESKVIKRVRKAASAINRTITPVSTGGGSDANILNGYGIETAIIGTGMKKVHTTDEYIDLEDMVRTAELVVGIITAP